MERSDLTATRFLTSRMFGVFVTVVGLFFVIRPGWPWNQLAELVGGETALIAIGVGVGLVTIAALSFEKDQMRVRIAELTEMMHQLLYGKDYKRQREAIEILLKALDSGDPDVARTAHENLVRLTGQQFAPDAGVWGSWWQSNRKRWSRADVQAANDPASEKPSVRDADEGQM